MLATDMTTSGSAEEKARWTFKMFDTDASGIKKHSYYYQCINPNGEGSGAFWVLKEFLGDLEGVG